MPVPSQRFLQSPTPEQRADIRLAASKMTGATRRSFEAEMTLKYCGGDARQAERVFGWGRYTVELGLAERRTGILCLGAQSACSGRKRWRPVRWLRCSTAWDFAYAKWSKLNPKRRSKRPMPSSRT